MGEVQGNLWVQPDLQSQAGTLWWVSICALLVSSAWLVWCVSFCFLNDLPTFKTWEISCKKSGFLTFRRKLRFVSTAATFPYDQNLLELLGGGKGDSLSLYCVFYLFFTPCLILATSEFETPCARAYVSMSEAFFPNRPIRRFAIIWLRVGKRRLLWPS